MHFDAKYPLYGSVTLVPHPPAMSGPGTFLVFIDLPGCQPGYVVFDRETEFLHATENTTRQFCLTPLEPTPELDATNEAGHD